MVILSDILLFITTALVLSVTILGIVLRVRVDDSFTGSFLLVLVPLSLQMCLTLLSNYLGRTLTDVQLASPTTSMPWESPSSRSFSPPPSC